MLDLIGGNQFMRQVVCPGTRERSLDQDPIAGSDHQAPGHDQQGGVAFFLQRAPLLVGALEQWDVVGMLEVRFPNDAAVAMRGPAVVDRGVLLKSNDTHSAAR